MTPEHLEKIRKIPARLRDYDQYVDAVDDAADAIEKLLAALDERDAYAREVIEAATIFQTRPPEISWEEWSRYCAASARYNESRK